MQPHQDPLLAQRLRRGIRRARQQATQAPGADDQTGYVDALLTDYDVIAPIRSGGQAAVFRALHRPTGRTVALKILLSERSDLRQRLRFEREVALVSRLQHVHIVPLYDCGEADGHLFYTMPIVEGLSIDGYALVHDLRVPDMITLFERVCRAVHFAHQNGVIHRDLHPDNILVAEDGEPRVLDFGLAGDGGWHEGHAAMGVLPYMSPEHLGHGDGLVDVRSDVYSLGVLLFLILTERLPYRLDAGEGLRDSILKGDLLPLRAAFRQSDPARRAQHRDCNADLAAIIARALATEKDDRYQSAMELANDLAAFRRGDAVSARPHSLAAVRVCLRRYRWGFAGAAVVLVSLVTAWVATAGYLRIERQRSAELLRHGEELGHVAASLTDLVKDTADSVFGGPEVEGMLDRRLEALSPIFDSVLTDQAVPDQVRLKFMAASARAAGEPDWPLGDEVRRVEHAWGSSGQIWRDYHRTLEQIGTDQGWTEWRLVEFLRASSVVAAIEQDPGLVQAALALTARSEFGGPDLLLEESRARVRLGLLFERQHRSPLAITAYDAAALNVAPEQASRNPAAAALRIEARMRSHALQRQTGDVDAGRQGTLAALAEARAAAEQFPWNLRIRTLLVQLRNHAAGVNRGLHQRSQARELLERNLEDIRVLQDLGLRETYELRCAVGQLVPMMLHLREYDAARAAAADVLGQLRIDFAEASPVEKPQVASDLASALNTMGRALSPYALLGRAGDLPASDPAEAVALHREAYALVMRYMHAGALVGHCGTEALHALRMEAANLALLGAPDAAIAILIEGLEAVGPQPELTRVLPSEELQMWILLGHLHLEQGACAAAGEALDRAEALAAQFRARGWVLPFQRRTRGDLDLLRAGVGRAAGRQLQGQGGRATLD